MLRCYDVTKMVIMYLPPPSPHNKQKPPPTTVKSPQQSVLNYLITAQLILIFHARSLLGIYHPSSERKHAQHLLHSREPCSCFSSTGGMLDICKAQIFSLLPNCLKFGSWVSLKKFPSMRSFFFVFRLQAFFKFVPLKIGLPIVGIVSMAIQARAKLIASEYYDMDPDGA